MQVAADVLRGFLGWSVGFALLGLSIWLFFPGMEMSPDRAVNSANKIRFATAAFGGVGILIAIALATFLVAINRLPQS